MQRALGRLGAQIENESYGHFAMRAAPVVLFATSLCTCLDIAIKSTFPLITNPESFIDACLFSNEFHLQDDDIAHSSNTCNGPLASSDNRGTFLIYTLGRFALTAACVSLPIP